MDVMNVPMFSHDEEEEARQSLAAQRAFSAMSRLRLQVGAADSVVVNTHTHTHTHSLQVGGADSVAVNVRESQHIVAFVE
jgi:hypothetical protein